jgi:molybdopterin converting factor small subunit
MSTIKIPTPLRPFTNNEQQVSVSGETVGAALNDLVTKYPDLKPHLYSNGQLRNFVNVFLGEDDIRFLDGLDTEIDASTALRIIPSIAGGDHTLTPNPSSSGRGAKDNARGSCQR